MVASLSTPSSDRDPGNRQRLGPAQMETKVTDGDLANNSCLISKSSIAPGMLRAYSGMLIIHSTNIYRVN